jgi:predicted membrane-bound dolichyl-phosphate-mannose-protein mannosyltransferase
MNPSPDSHAEVTPEGDVTLEAHEAPQESSVEVEGKPIYQRVRGLTSKKWAPFVALLFLSGVSLGARVPWLFSPRTQNTIFDETYYVNAARVILGRPAAAPYDHAEPGKDPNSEHPPLAKVIIAGSIWALGDRPFGWRMPSILFGSGAVLAMYWLVRKAGGSPWFAVGSSAILVGDNLFLVHSGIATLDIFVVLFMLLGAGFYLSGRPISAGVALGIGACMKTVSLYMVPVLIIYELLALRARSSPAGKEQSVRSQGARLVSALVATLVSYLGALWVLDLAVTNYTNPITHTAYMVGYHTRILDPNLAGPGITSTPWQWLFNQRPIPYYTSIGSVHGRPAYSVFFVGKISPFIIWLAFPAFVLAVAAAWKQRDRLAMFVVAWCLGTYLPFVVLGREHISYLYYMLSVLPGIYIGVARLFSGRYLPKVFTYLYGAALIYGFVAFYPLKG